MNLFIKTAIVLTLSFLASMDLSNSMAAIAGELTADLNVLKSAVDFSRGEKLGQKANAQFAAYRNICTNWTKLGKTDLEDLLKSATPAGKLYAAALVWETNCYRGQPNKMKTGFESLKDDKSKVIYRTGCCVSEHTVGEIASVFIKDGQFQDFGVSRWCEKPVREQ